MLVSGRCWGWLLESVKELGTGAGKQERVEDGCRKVGRAVVGTWSGDEGVEIVAVVVVVW